MPADNRSLIQTAPICRYFICCLTGQHFVLSFSLIHNVQRISAYPAEQKENFHPSRLCLCQNLTESRVSVHIGPHLGDPFHLDHKGHPAADPGLLSLGQFLQVLDASFCRRIRKVADAVHFQGAALHLQQVELARLSMAKSIRDLSQENSGWMASKPWVSNHFAVQQHLGNELIWT